MADQETIRRMVANEADMAYRRRVQTIFDWLDPQEGDRILDAGCGRGFYPRFIRAASSAEVVGLELEFDYVQIARRALAGLDGITLVNGSLYDPPFPDEYFDKVILSEVLEHVPDDVGALRALARVLKPGGLIAITVPNANYPFWWDPINKTLETLFHTHISRGPLAGIWANHVRLYTADRLRQAVLEAGFEVEEERAFTHHSFPFIHNLVYGLGKPLLESGLLPKSMAEAADRTAFDRDSGGRLNPIRIGIQILNYFDRKNVINEPPGRSTVNLALKGRKPLR